jgi:hypothetical protein
MLTRHRLIRSLLGLLRRGRGDKQRSVAEPPIFLAPF